MPCHVFSFDKSVNAILDSVFLISSRFWYLQKHRSDLMQRRNMRWNFLLRQKINISSARIVWAACWSTLCFRQAATRRRPNRPLCREFSMPSKQLCHRRPLPLQSTISRRSTKSMFFSLFYFFNFTENENFPFRWSFDCFCFELLAFPIFITYFQSPLFAQMLRGHGARIYELCDQGYCLF